MVYKTLVIISFTSPDLYVWFKRCLDFTLVWSFPSLNMLYFWCGLLSCEWWCYVTCDSSYSHRIYYCTSFWRMMSLLCHSMSWKMIFLLFSLSHLCERLKYYKYQHLLKRWCFSFVLLLCWKMILYMLTSFWKIILLFVNILK